ncbi:MAG: dihydrodipicolinate reductase [Rhodobacteraceae bacterium PARR1]|nr:MAG: dihydrodipicolinate reductase [Rhodobacteraceae bacterium PARR1]
MFRPVFSLLVLILSLIALPARAEGYERIATREDFVAAVEGRDMRIGLLGITLNVRADGTITGDAMGWPVTGKWDWQDGFFCREMDWSGTPIPYNCQLVERRGDDIRFTVDKGKGDSARFALR